MTGYAQMCHRMTSGYKINDSEQWRNKNLKSPSWRGQHCPWTPQTWNKQHHRQLWRRECRLLLQLLFRKPWRRRTRDPTDIHDNFPSDKSTVQEMWLKLTFKQLRVLWLCRDLENMMILKMMPGTLCVSNELMGYTKKHLLSFGDDTGI